MNLKFSKNESKDVEVQVQNGTSQQAFSYIEMIKSLLKGENLTTEFSEDMTDEEKRQINELVNKIKSIASVPKEGALDLFDK